MLFSVELIIGLQEEAEALPLDRGDDIFPFGKNLKEDDAPVLSVRRASQVFFLFKPVDEVGDGGFCNLKMVADLSHGNGAERHELVEQHVLRERQVDPVKHLGVHAGELRLEFSKVCCKGLSLVHNLRLPAG